MWALALPLALAALGIRHKPPPPAWVALQPTGSYVDRRSSPACLLGLEKTGFGRDAWWLLGEYRGRGLDVEVQYRLDANPSAPCYIFELVSRADRATVGRMLLLGGDGLSGVRGMYVREDLRGRGLSKLLLAIWVRMCLRACPPVRPHACLIRKPLLSLSLMHFGFRPKSTGSPVLLDAPQALLDGPDAAAPARPQRKAYVLTEFSAPADLAALDAAAGAELGAGLGTLHIAASPADLARALTLR